jgi:hypothetical protein
MRGALPLWWRVAVAGGIGELVHLQIHSKLRGGLGRALIYGAGKRAEFCRMAKDRVHEKRVPKL